MTTADGHGFVPQRIEYVLTADDYVAFNVHASWTIPENERQIARGRIWGALLIAVGALVFGLALFDVGPVVPWVLAALGVVAWWVLALDASSRGATQCRAHCPHVRPRRARACVAGGRRGRAA